MPRLTMVPVSKAAPVKTAVGLARRNYRSALLPATVIGASTAGAAHESAQQRRQAGHGDGHQVLATAAGAGAGEAAWRGVGLGVIRREGKKRERPRPGQSRSNYQKLVSNHKKAHGVGGLQGQELRNALQRKPAYFRTYPKELSGWQFKRTLGHMSGKRGLAAEAGVVGVGALAGHRAGRQEPVHKGVVELGLAALGARALFGSPAGRGLREGIKRAGSFGAWSAHSVSHGALAPTVVHNAHRAIEVMPTVIRRPVQNATSLGITYHANRS